MSEALKDDAGFSVWEPVPGVEKLALAPEAVDMLVHTARDRASLPIPARQIRHKSLPAGAVDLAALPTVGPSQLWYVELPSAEREFSPLEYQVLTTANVVIYDRALASTVAKFRPMGGYAEPAAPSNLASDLALERCARFARDGWSVARLVDRDRERVARIPQLSEWLQPVKSPVGLPVELFVNTGGRYGRNTVEISELGDIINCVSLGQTITLVIRFSGIDAGAAPRFSVASANGLAG
jgi:hypothetical protein